MNLDFSVEHVPDDWEALADAGRMLTRNMDAHRFDLGDLAGRVEGRYGTDALGQFCADIGMARTSTLKVYRAVSRRYERVTRVTFLDAGLSWTHFREALRAGEDAELFLARAADEGLTVAALAREIARAKGERVPPRKVFEGPGVIGETADGMLYIVPDGDCSELAAGLRVVVKVYTEAAP